MSVIGVPIKVGRQLIIINFYCNKILWRFCTRPKATLSLLRQPLARYSLFAFLGSLYSNKQTKYQQKLGSGLPWQADRGWGQHELTDGLRYGHLQGRQGGSAREHLHQGLQDQILDPPRYTLNPFLLVPFIHSFPPQTCWRMHRCSRTWWQGAVEGLRGASLASWELRQGQVDAAGEGGCRRTGEVEGETGGAGVETGEDLVEEVGTGVGGEVGNWMPSGLFWDKCNVGLIVF